MLKKDTKHKQNLEGLLRLAVENSGQTEAAPNANLSATDVEFLQHAIKSMTTNNGFESAVANLNNESTDIADKLESLNVIRNNIDDIDMANSFVKIGGITTLLQFITKPDYELRPESTYIVAEMAQNNEFCQNYFLTEKIIPVLISTMNDNDENVARSSIFAVSSLIQNFPPGLTEFLRVDGIQTLLSCLSSAHKAVYIKAAFLIGFLSSNDSSVRDLINKQNGTLMLLNNLENKNEYDDKLEATLNALSALSLDCKWNLTQKQHREAASTLKQIISNKTLLDASEDMVNNARSILDTMTKK